MRVWVKTGVSDPIAIDINECEEITEIKTKIKNALNNQNVYVPPENILLFQGKALTSQALQKLRENDLLYFIFNLKAKPPLPPQLPASPLPAKSANPKPLEEMTSDQNVGTAQSLVSVKEVNLIDMLPQITQGLQTLTEMGFPEQRATRALLLNNFNAELAASWLLEHSDDPQADSPITREEIEQYILPNMGITLRAALEEKIAAAIQANKCTYTVTGRNYARQEWYHCYTCGLVDSEGCCAACVRVCHQGHKISESVDRKSVV